MVIGRETSSPATPPPGACRGLFLFLKRERPKKASLERRWLFEFISVALRFRSLDADLYLGNILPEPAYRTGRLVEGLP